MDFSVLLKDLRDVAEKYQGKSTEPQVSTHAYVDMFTKILKKALAVTEQYDDQITVLWVALNQLASIYKDLTAGAARDQLCKFIFGLCAKTVLNIQWAQLDDDSKVKTNFSTTLEEVHKILSQLGFLKFQLILDLMESHWTHPVLSKIMSGEEEDTEDCLEYIQKEDPDILKLRIEIMMKENCEEFALNLCNWSLKHPTLQNDLKIKEHQIFILYKQQEYGKMQEACETIICHDGIKVMSHLAKTPSNQELCIRLAQVFLIQDWVKTERTCCTQELLKLWIHHQYLADKDEERFLDSIWTVAKVCRDTEQIGVLIDGVKKECGDMFIQLYSELCKFAINIDKGNMEREEVQNDPEEYNKRRLAMSKTCVRMAFMLKEYDFRISRICGLTAFTLDPTMDNLNLVNKLYWTIKNVSAASQNSKINIATLYEIERLLGQMRPESLNPEYSWKQLIPVCKKYKLDYENDKSSIPFKNVAKRERTASQSSVENTVTPVTAVSHMMDIVKSDKVVTKKIDTGQKKGRKPKNALPKDIQKAHLAKMLGQKNLSKEEIEKVLSNEFPRNIKQEFNDAPSLDVKELDKTINDLKKSIYLETQYRERIKNNLSSLQKCKKVKAEPGEDKKQHLSRQELFRQQQQIIHKKEPCYQRQQSAPGGSQLHGPILQRQLSMGSPQPPNAHSHHRQQMSPPFGGSPPPAHSTSPRMSSPVGFSSSLSPPGFRNPNILGGRKSDTYSHKNTSQNHPNIPQQLCNKIKAELQQQSKPAKAGKSTAFNVLRPPGNSNQECAKIAQQIAEMHERQRAEKLQTARLQGQIDGAKVALNSRNIPSRSQISDLLSMTFQGSKGQNIDGQKSPSLQGSDTNHSKNYLKKKLERSASVSSAHNFTSPEVTRRQSVPTQHADLSNVRNSTFSSPSQLSAPSSVSSTSNESQSTASFVNSAFSNRSHSVGRSPNDNYANSSISNRSNSVGRIPNENHSNSSKVDSNMLVPGEQGWDPSRGIMKQKYYYKPAKSKDSVPKGSTGDKPLAMKPVYSMIVPKELTNPNRKDDLVKTVTDMMKRFPKGINSQQKSSEQSTAVVKVKSQTSAMVDHKNVTTGQQFQNKTSPPKLIPTSSVSGIRSDSSLSGNQHFNIQPPMISANSTTIGQNFVEEGLLNLNTLAAASISVLGQDSPQQPVIGSLQLTQSVQQQPIQQQHQMFGNPVIESQPMFSPIQPVQVSVQQVVQQPEPILATPLYTMPNPVIPEPVLTQQFAGIQPHVDIALQQPVLQQIIAVQNQPIAMNHTQSYVNVVSQQPSFQVPPVGQVNFNDVTQSMTVGQPITSGMSPSITSGIPQQIPGGIASNVMDGIPQSLAIPSEIMSPISSNQRPQTSSLEESLPSKQFLAKPELSPALFQQILSSLKKGGVRSNNKIHLKGSEDKQALSKGKKQQSDVVSKSQASVIEAVKDSVKQFTMNKNQRIGNQSVNEAKQKILELRKQFHQAAEPSTSLPEVSTVLPNRQVPTSMPNTVASPRRGSGILERLMTDGKEVKVNTEIRNIQTFNSKENVTSQTSDVVSQQSLPELVDLGAKEFQLDSFLAFGNDNNISSENTIPNKHIVPVNSNEQATNHRPSTTGSGNDHQFKSVQENSLYENDVQQFVPTVVNTNAFIENKQKMEDVKHKELISHSPSQSTYLNANRLGKERENREVKSSPDDTEELVQAVNSQLKLQNLCVNCDVQFPTEQHLIDHKKQSICEPKYKCVYCKMSFKCAEILKSHEKNYCLKAPSTMVRCCICGVYFQSHEQLKSHLNPKTCKPQNMFKDKSQSVEDIVCGICKRKFESMTLIKEHVKVGCLNKDNNTYSKVVKIGDFDFSVVFKCTKCNFINLNENIVSKHVEKCKENNSSAKLTVMYACNMCEASFCVREDACRHVKRQCSKLKVLNSQKQVQDVYQKIKDANSAVNQKIRKKIDKEQILCDSKEKHTRHIVETGMSKDILVCKNDKNQKDNSGKPPLEPQQQEKTNIKVLKPKTNITKISVEKGSKGNIKVTASENTKSGIKPAQIHEKMKGDDKKPHVIDNKSKVPDPLKTEPNDDKKVELAAQIQKVQRITAENRFLAEFNEIEKRKQAIRMKKQKELEKQQEILIKKEQEKELELMKQKKSQEMMEDEQEKINSDNEKQGKERNVFETEKEQYVNSIIGTSTLKQKMKESIEKEKKSKMHGEYEKDKKVSNKLINVYRNEKTCVKQDESCPVDINKDEPKQKIKTETEMNETESNKNYQDDKNLKRIVMNKKRKKNQMADMDDNNILPEEKRVLREQFEESERKNRHIHVGETESKKQSHGILKKKQLSPQDIRKLRGLRAKRLIKKKKYFIDEMEPIQRGKLKKETDVENECQNMIQRIKQNHLHRKIRTEIKGQEIEIFHKVRNKNDKEKGRIKSKKSRDNASELLKGNIDNKVEDTKNQLKEVNPIYYWKKVCRFCGLSKKGINILSHYVQTHKLGFRQMSYSYYCNFCNMKFPITQTVQVKEHVYNKHREAVLGRVAIGRYDKKVDSSPMNKSGSPVKKTNYVPTHIGKSSKRRKHIRALELRKKCAEKLKAITLVRKNSIIDISDLEEESQASYCSTHSTDTESPIKEEHIIKIERKGKNANDESELRDGRRIAPRRARQMVKSTVARSKRINYFEELKKTSDVDDSSDTQVMTRSRSSSVSSNRSSLIASAKKRKSAITVATRGSLKPRQDKSGSLLLTRSGRAVKRPEIDYDKLTESSSFGSGEDNSELEDSDKRKRKSTRIRRLSEKGKSLRGTTSDTDESSTEEIKRRVTRRSFSKSQKGNDGSFSESLNTDDENQVIVNKRPRVGQSPGSKSSIRSLELRSVKNKVKGRERVNDVNRVTTRQNSKNEEESDSETESNYTDIEHVFKMLGNRKVRNAAIRSAESDSESTSANENILKRKYKLRKRHANRKYQESESSAEDVTDLKQNDGIEAENVSDLEQLGDNFTLTEKVWLESKQSNDIIYKGDDVYEEKPKVVLIGPEEDDDLNVDYPQPLKENSRNDNNYNQDEYQFERINSKLRTVLVDPQDEFAGLEASPEKSHGREKSAESEIMSESVSEVDTEMELSTLPASVMDDDEFEFLKSDQTLSFKVEESNMTSSLNSSHKAAYDSEFIRYTKSEEHEYSSDSEFELSESSKENIAMKNKDSDESVLSKKNTFTEEEIPQLADDVPVLPPRNFALSDKKRLLKDSNTKELIATKKKGRPFKKNDKPSLKYARVVIEDISVTRKALEADNVEKKLIQECESSSCLVRIGRLSREEIEKHTPSLRNTVKAKGECEILVLDDSDDENVINKNPKGDITVYNESDQRPMQNNLPTEKSQTDHAKTIKLNGQQCETLIQDIVLDGSFIDQLLVDESITLNIQTEEQITEGNDASSIQGAECVQVIVEDNITNHKGTVLVVDVKSETNNESDEVIAGNVLALIANSQKDSTNEVDQSTNQVEEEEEDVWIENAESYAETPNKSENCESIVYENIITQLEDKETFSIPDYSNLHDLPKEEHIVLSSFSNDEIESSTEQPLNQENEIIMTASNEESQHQIKGTEGERDEKTERKEEKTNSLITSKECDLSECPIAKSDEAVTLTGEENDYTKTSANEDLNPDKDIVSTDTGQQILECNASSIVDQQDQQDQLNLHIPNSLSYDRTLNESANQNTQSEKMQPENNLDIETLDGSDVGKKEKSTEPQASEVESNEDVEMMNLPKEPVIGMKNEVKTFLLGIEQTGVKNVPQENKQHKLQVEDFQVGRLLKETEAKDSHIDEDNSDKILPVDLKEIPGQLAVEAQSDSQEAYLSELSEIPPIQSLQETEVNDNAEDVISPNEQLEQPLAGEFEKTIDILKPVLDIYAESTKSTLQVCGHETSFLTKEKHYDEELPASGTDNDMDIITEKHSLNTIDPTRKKQLKITDDSENCTEDETDKDNKKTFEIEANEKIENQASETECFNTDYKYESMDLSKQQSDEVKSSEQYDIEVILSEVCAEVARNTDILESKNDSMFVSEMLDDTFPASDTSVESVLTTGMLFKETSTMLPTNINDVASSLENTKSTGEELEKTTEVLNPVLDSSVENATSTLDMCGQETSFYTKKKQNDEELPDPETDNDMNVDEENATYDTICLTLKKQIEVPSDFSKSQNNSDGNNQETPEITNQNLENPPSKVEHINADSNNENIYQTSQQSDVEESSEQDDVEVVLSESCAMVDKTSDTLESNINDTTSVIENSNDSFLTSVESEMLLHEASTHLTTEIKGVANLSETLEEKNTKQKIVVLERPAYDSELETIASHSEYSPDLEVSQDATKEKGMSIFPEKEEKSEVANESITSSNSSLLALQTYSDSSDSEEEVQIMEVGAQKSDEINKQQEICEVSKRDAIDKNEEGRKENKQKIEDGDPHEMQEYEKGESNVTEQLQSLNKSNSNIAEMNFSVDMVKDDDSSAGISESAEENNEVVLQSKELHSKSLALETHEDNDTTILKTESLQSSDLSVGEMVKKEIYSNSGLLPNLAEANIESDVDKNDIESNLTEVEIASAETPIEDDMLCAVNMNFSKTTEQQGSETETDFHLSEEKILECANSLNKSDVKNPLTESFTEPEQSNHKITNTLPVNEDLKEQNADTIICDENDIEKSDLLSQLTMENDDIVNGLCTTSDVENEESALDILGTNDTNENELSDVTCIDLMEEVGHHNIQEQVNERPKVENAASSPGSSLDQHEPEVSSCSFIEAKGSLSKTGMDHSEQDVKENVWTDANTQEELAEDVHTCVSEDDIVSVVKESVYNVHAKFEQNVIQVTKNVEIDADKQDEQAEGMHTCLGEEDLVRVVNEIADNVHAKFEQNVIQGTEISETLTSLDQFHETSETMSKTPKAKIGRQTSVSSGSDISLISFPEDTAEQNEQCEENNDKSEVVDYVKTIEKTDIGLRKRSLDELMSAEESQQKISIQSYADSTTERSSEAIIDQPISEEFDTQFLERSDDALHENVIKEQDINNIGNPKEIYVHINEDHQDDNKIHNSDDNSVLDTYDAKLDITSYTSDQVDKVEGYEEIHEDESSILKNVSKETIIMSEKSNFESCNEASFEIYVDNKSLIQETEQEGKLTHQSLAANEKNELESDKNIEYETIENERREEADSNFPDINEKVCIIEKSIDQNNLTQNATQEMRQTENAQEGKHIQEENTDIHRLNYDIGKNSQHDVDQFEVSESQPCNEQQTTDFLKDDEVKISEESILRGSGNHTSKSGQDQQFKEDDMEVIKLNDVEENRQNDEKKEVETLPALEDNNTEEILNINEETSPFGTSYNDTPFTKTNINSKTQTTQNSQRSNSSSTDEEDPTLDKWVKEILNQEEKREVFEVPSPRRKGMIVGTTCVHKKPTNPFVDTKASKKEENPKKDTKNVVVKTGARKTTYEEKNEMSNLEKPRGNILVQDDVKTVITEDIDRSSEKKQVCVEKEITESLKKVDWGTKKIENKSIVMKKPTEYIGRKIDASSSTDNQKSGQDNLVFCTGSTQTVDASSIVCGREMKAKKVDDNKSRNQRNVRQKTSEITETVIKEDNGNKEEIINQSSQNLTSKTVNLKVKSIEKKNVDLDNQFEEIQRADETDEEFMRRTEAVRIARRKSSVKPYESDFNFEDNARNLKEADNKAKPSTSFWPSDRGNTVDNFDAASLYSSSSGSSGNTSGLKEGKLKVIERCARDFGKDEAVPRIHQQLPRTNIQTMLPCSLPENATISSMSLQIVKSMGASNTKPIPSAGKVSRQQSTNSILSTKMKMIDKNVLSNINLSERMVKIMKSSPAVEKSLSTTPSNIKKLYHPQNISKDALIVKKNKESLTQKTNMIVRKSKDKNVTSIDDKNLETVIGDDFEPSEENLSKKTKALRALHKKDKPFNWENNPSPPKMLRSQANKVDNKLDNECIEPKGKPITRQTKEKLPKLKQTNAVSIENLRESKKKICEKSNKKASSKQDKVSETLSTLTKGRKRSKRDKDKEKNISSTRRTRSRSGSKDKLKVDIPNPEKPVKGKKQSVSKSEHNDVDSKSNSNSLETESKNTALKTRTAPMKLRHTSGDSINDKDREHKDQNEVKVTAEPNENKESKSRKRISEIKKELEAETQSNDEPAVGIQTLPEEPATKVCKLDGTAKSPEKIDASVCGHKLKIPGCDSCIERQSGSQKLGLETIRPAVRQIIHGGKVFQIQRGSVTETDLQNFKGEDMVEDQLSTSNDDTAMKRSKRIERRKRAHSPEKVVFRDMKNPVGISDINKYITKALSDIKRQRYSNSSSKWTVKQKKKHNSSGFPYSFKKANPKP